MSLKDTVVLVTNAHHGAGLACAHRLAAAGAGVMFSAPDDDAVAQTEGDLQQHGVATYGMTADLARGTDVEALLGEAMRVYGRLDGVVVVTAPTPARPLLDADDADFDRSMAAGARAAFVVCRRVARLLVGAGKGGSLVIVGGSDDVAGAAAAVSREALTGLARVLAAELRAHDVRVNAVVPAQGADQATAVAAVASFLVGREAATVSGAVIDLGAG
jgi:NAD(P)-dependent dehydrogenase (short-subunit alcohol dehydrogenase family)